MLGKAELVSGDQLGCSREVIKGDYNGPSSAKGKISDPLEECLLWYIKLSFTSSYRFQSDSMEIFFYNALLPF